MGFAYHAGTSDVPFPLCLLGLTPGIKLGDFYMGAWVFFAIVVCVLGSKHPLSATQAAQNPPSETPAPAMVTKGAATIVEVRGHESDKVFMKTRVIDSDTETDEEPLVVATVIGQPVSSPSPSTSPSTSTLVTGMRKRNRCGRPVHGSRAMKCCWAAHFFLTICLICVPVFVFCLWVDYSPEQEVDSASSKEKDDNSLFGWDAWYFWFLALVFISCTYRTRHRANGCRCCR